MSDYGGDDEYEYGFEDEDGLYYTEEPVYEADDLAEHTLHSPVWHAYDVTYDTAEVWTEWEYYTDEFFDESGHATREKKQRRTKESSDGHTTALDEEGVPNASVLRMSAITNRKGLADIPGELIFDETKQEKVALLKNWRERFKGILPEERSSASKDPAVITSGHTKDPKKRGLETPGESFESPRVQMPLSYTKPSTKALSRSTSASGTSKLRHQYVAEHKPMSPLKSQTKGLPAEDFAPLGSQKLDLEEVGRHSFGDADVSSGTSANAHIQTPPNVREGEMARRKRKTAVEDETPHDSTWEIGNSRNRRKIDALPSVRKSKRLKS